MARFVSVVALLCLGTAAVAAPIPAGEHPRILFTRAQLPAIRERLATAEGQRLLEQLAADARKFSRDFDQAFPADAPPVAETRADLVARLRAGKLPYFDDVPYRAGLLAQLTDDPEDRRRAANYVRAWLESLVPEDGIVETQGWGNPRLALAYDLAYRDLTEAERQTARDLISACGLSPAMQQALRTQWYVWGPNRANGSQSNWDCIYSSNTLVTMMAVEGEPCRFTVDPDAFANSVAVLRSFLLDGITPDGAFFDGLTYPQGYGTHFTPHALIGLRLRGVDAAAGTNATRPGLWLTYEMLPWGGEGQDMNKSGGDFVTTGMFATWLAVHGADLAHWYYRASSGELVGLPPRMCAEIALVEGIPETGDWTPDKLPPGHWFSVVGKVVSRGGWGPRDSHFVISANPISTGHSHADNGQFCFADRGVNFITDSGGDKYTTDEHNLVLVDGKGQARDEGSVEAYIRAADFSAYADATDVDLEESYTRFISGALDGPWHYESYNPVERADRRTLFIRGATGTILAVADDLRKDDEAHDYQLRLHSGRNNRIEAVGRRFTISERYGGPVLQSAGRGQECTLVAVDVPAGKYRCWALVRGLPWIGRNWSNTGVAVNGRNVRYNSTYFALGGFRDGWRWNEIRVDGPGSDPWIDLPAGKLEVKLTGSTGSQVGMFVFSSRPEWEPGFAVHPEPGVVVLGADSAVQGEPPWDRLDDPQAVLAGVFIGGEAPALSVEHGARTGQPRLLADRHAIDWQSVCVVAADDVDARRQVEELGTDTVRYRRGEAVDYVTAGRPGMVTGEMLETDGVVAAAALPAGTLADYALLHGQVLRFDGADVVRADRPATVLCDGAAIVVRAPGGTRVTCRRLTARTLRVNGADLPLPAGDTPVVVVPELPAKWQIEMSADGRVVTVTGNGPRPLKIHAPEARELFVNGVRRHFIRSERLKGEGWIWPYLESMACWQYAGEVGADALKSWMTAGEAVPAAVPGSTEAALRVDRGATLRVPLSGPAEYEMMLRAYATEDTEVLLRAGDVVKSWQLKGGVTSGKTFTGFQFTGDTGELLLLGTAPFYLKGVLMKPRLTLVPPPRWAVIGPFPAGPQTADDIKKAMAHAFVPEDGTVDLAATFTGADDKPLAWVQGQAFADANDYKLSMWSKQLDFKNQGIAYAVTFIDCPTARSADLGIKVDYWANAWLNGEKVVSERPRRQVERDGCEFNNALTRAHLRLRKGRNVLMVKVRGGNGSNAFSGYLTNPGDLVVSWDGSATGKRQQDDPAQGQ